MSKKIAIIAFFLLFLFVFAPAKSFANTNDFGDSEIFSADSAKMLTREAKIIIKGEVKSVKSFRGINDVVYTRASVLISDFIKGKVAKKNIIVEYKKGEVDLADSFMSLETENAPSLKQGEAVILFLTNSFWRKNVYYLVGGSSGKYAVCADNTIKISSSCDEESETKTIGETKETTDDLLSEIKNAE
ncbi:MAG: hypothetical protein AAB818_00315 [Patescibacteria group bacterium]